MTEAPTTRALVRHGIYSHYGIARIAIDDNTLQSLTGTDTVTITSDEVSLMSRPGSEDWVDHMVRVRESLNRALRDSLDAQRTQSEHLERLGEALLEEAISRDWCEEYDAFAEQWGLPTRNREYEVVMTVRVTARYEDDAVEAVRGCVNITQYDEGVASDPEFYASEA